MPGGGSDCLRVLILNKLLKNNDAQIVHYAANAVSEYATSTRDLRRTGHDIAALPNDEVFEVGIRSLRGGSPDPRGAEREF